MKSFEVEKKTFKVKFVGSHGGTWITITKRSRDRVLLVGLEKEEMDWLSKQLKKVVGLAVSMGFIWKFRDKLRTHLLETCFNNRERFIKISEFVTNRKISILVVPEGIKSGGWETLRKVISSVVESTFHIVSVLKEVIAKKQVCIKYYRGNRSYADVVVEEGPRKGGLLLVGRWARAVICESQRKVQGWVSVGKAIVRLMGMKGMVSINLILEHKGCFFFFFLWILLKMSSGSKNKGG